MTIAVESDSGYAITHNLKDFDGADQFEVRTVTPMEFLREIGEIA